MSIETRLAALEQRSKGGEMLVIRIEGGLPLGLEPATATAGGHRWQQGANEPEDAFADRVTALASAANERTLLIGGLPLPTP